MISARITVGDQKSLDLTGKIKVDQGIVITQELERRAFERTVDDVRLTLTDLHGQFSAFFSDVRPTTRYQLEVFGASRRLFRGYIDNSSIDFSRTEKTVALDAFSTTKIFWERAKVTRIHPTTPEVQANPFIDLQTLLNKQASYTNLHDNFQIFRLFNCGLYADRQIRIAGVTTNPVIGNEGLFIYLKDETTWDDFLKACAIQYNAEFYVDPDTQNVMMVKRGRGMSTFVKQLDPILVGDKNISVRFIDDQKIDWLYIHSGVQQEPPVITGYTRYVPPQPDNPILGLAAGSYWYVMTSIVEDIEACMSAPTSIVIPTSGTTREGYLVNIIVPASGVQGTTARKLYRLSSDTGAAGYRLVTRIPGNAATAFTDSFKSAQIQSNDQPTTFAVTFNQWVTFDEAGSGWGTTVLDIGNPGSNEPQGIILDAAPKLTFKVGDTEIFNDPFWVYSLFAKERDFKDAMVRDDWVDMFRMKRRLDCRVKGIDFRVGDRYQVSQQIVPNDLTLRDELVIKKAGIDGMKEEADLMLLTV